MQMYMIIIPTLLFTLFFFFKKAKGILYSPPSIMLSPRKPLDEIQPKIVSEYDQEIPQSQTADNPVAPRGRAAQPSRDTRKTN